MSHIASAKVARARCRHVQQHQRRLVASRQSESRRRIRSTRKLHLCNEKKTQGFRLEAELISAAFDLDPSGGDGEVLAFLQACVRNMNDVVELVSAKVGSTASVCFRAELRRRLRRLPRRTRLWLAQLCGQRKFISRRLGWSLAGCCIGSYGGGCRLTAGLRGVTCSELRRTEPGGWCEHMCLADEDVPQRGRSRGKVEAAREEEALCSGRSLRFDHSRCYEG